MSKPHAKQEYGELASAPVFTPRFLIAVVLGVVGIAWIVFYYVAVRVDASLIPQPDPGSPKFMADLGNWNYLIGFGLLLLGLAISAHPSTPLGRGRGVVVGMLACFLIGLLWICTFYVVSDDPSAIPVMNDLEQYNLLVGIAFMAVGFTFATRWGVSSPPVNVWALRRWPGHLLVLVLLGGAVMLGAWQFGSFQGERDAAARDLTRGEPVALGAVLGPNDPFPAPSVGQPVALSGDWVEGATVFVERDAGYWVVTPLAVDGPGSAALPVVRGVSVEPVAEPVSGRAELTGWLQPAEGTGAVDDDPTDDVLPQLRVADLVQRVDGDLYSAYAVATEPTAGLAAASLEQLPDAGRFTGLRNFLYALEWWVFGGFAVFVWVKYLRDEAAPDDAEPDRRLAS